MVDPWRDETACETCYAQLDGTDALSDSLPDLALGRLLVKQVSELQALVAKLLQYEAQPNGDAWQSRAVYIADEADRAGDFAAIAEASIALQPASIDVQRVFYDPTASGGSVAWREQNPLKAR